MEYSIVNVNGRASYTAVPRRPKRGNQIAILIAAVVLLIYGPMQIPFMMQTTERSVATRHFNNSVYDYGTVFSSIAHRERDGVKYATVTLSRVSRGAIFHVLASKRLDGVLLLLDGCGPTIERMLSSDGAAVLRAAGRAHFLPVTVAYPADDRGRCSDGVTSQSVTADVVTSLDHLIRLSGTVGLPVVIAAVGSGVDMAVPALLLRMIQANHKAEAGEGISFTAGIIYGTQAPQQLKQQWKGLLGVQASINIVLVTPPADLLGPEGDSRLTAEATELATLGVSLRRIARECHECQSDVYGHPLMDPSTLRAALQQLSFRLRKL